MEQKNNIVLVTCNIPLADFLAIELGKNGWSVFVAPDVNSGRFLIGSESPKLIILDSLLPNNSVGFLLSWIKKTFPALPYALLTTKGFNTNISSDAPRGIIQQDIEPAKISGTLNDLLQTI